MHPLKFLSLLVAAAVLLAAVAAGGAILYGRERIWREAFGMADLGPYDFSQPTRSGKMNDALACPPASCVEARPTLQTPRFSVGADQLLEAARAWLNANPLAEIVDDRPAVGQLRAVVRTPLMRFPDTLSVRTTAIGEEASQLWVYSRSQIGHSDLGTNRKRINRLIAHLRETLPAEAAGTELNGPAQG